jgi:ATP-dependent helicase/nuclease subunit B
VTTHLYLAPAGCGKTTYVVQRARAAAAQLESTAWICVASPLQRWAMQRRIAAAGGAIGVYTGLFTDLHLALLRADGERSGSYTFLSEPVQYRLLRGLVQQLDLRYFARLVSRPGFIQVLQQLIVELKGARIDPADLAQAVAGEDSRLGELAAIYLAYQERLQVERWADRAGLGWLALEALEREPALAGRWGLLCFDGFDSFTVSQCALLQALQGRAGELVITLTGDAAADTRAAHRRFHETRRQLEEALAIGASALPERQSCDQPALRHLEQSLFQRESKRQEAGDSVQLLAAPDRAGEVREALRWLKEQHLALGLPLHHFALLARDLEPYAPFVEQIAAAFGLPIYAPDGPPLGRNPLIAALLNLLRLMLPATDGSGEFNLPRAGVVAAWRSPYFEWSTAAVPNTEASVVGIQPGDAEALDEVARRGRVVAGLSQWREALLAEQLRPAAQPAGDGDGMAVADAPQRLLEKFELFVACLAPPPLGTYRTYIAWLEALIGDDPQAPVAEREGPAGSLQVVAGIDRGDEQSRRRDRAALLALKELLRGLLMAEASLDETDPVSYPAFFQELAGAVEGSFLPPPGEPGGAILTANIPQARGLPFAAVAILGLGEGSFPATLREDPFLRDDDRARLRAAGLPLESSVLSREREYFYETVARPWRRLLLVRARLADDGAAWEPSPFWDEVGRRLVVAPLEIGSQDVVLPQRAASPSELVESLVAHRLSPDANGATVAGLLERWQALQDAARIFRGRYKRQPGPHDGDLALLASELQGRFGASYEWSATQIETYLSCAHRFLCERVLRLQPRPRGAFALDPAQLGAIFHKLLQQVYTMLPEAQRTDAAALLAALDTVAPRILAAAPVEHGFRPAAWWEQTQAEITQTIARTLTELAGQAGDFVPASFEHYFGKEQPLRLARDGEQIRLSGFIDRVDRDSAGRVRIIDYKSGGSQGYSETGVQRGEHIQLPLYALAAREALGLGEVADGFYWHVRDARMSPLRLGPGNLETMTTVAEEHAWGAVDGARAGAFGPEPPRNGCPDYCSAAAFCWHFRPRYPA